MLAERKGKEAGRFRIRHAAADARGNGGIERAVGKGGQLARHFQQRKGAGQIADSQREGQRLLLAAQGYGNVRRALARRESLGQRCLAITRGKDLGEVGQAVEKPGQIGRVGAGAG